MQTLTNPSQSNQETISNYQNMIEQYQKIIEKRKEFGVNLAEDKIAKQARALIDNLNYLLINLQK